MLVSESPVAEDYTYCLMIEAVTIPPFKSGNLERDAQG
jgi:hypothetical protein